MDGSQLSVERQNAEMASKQSVSPSTVQTHPLGRTILLQEQGRKDADFVSSTVLYNSRKLTLSRPATDSSGHQDVACRVLENSFLFAAIGRVPGKHPFRKRQRGTVALQSAENDGAARVEASDEDEDEDADGPGERREHRIHNWELGEIKLLKEFLRDRGLSRNLSVKGAASSLGWKYKPKTPQYWQLRNKLLELREEMEAADQQQQQETDAEQDEQQDEEQQSGENGDGDGSEADDVMPSASEAAASIRPPRTGSGKARVQRGTYEWRKWLRAALQQLPERQGTSEEIEAVIQADPDISPLLNTSPVNGRRIAQWQQAIRRNLSTHAEFEAIGKRVINGRKEKKTVYRLNLQTTDDDGNVEE